jgi:hypothetical protein
LYPYGYTRVRGGFTQGDFDTQSDPVFAHLPNTIFRLSQTLQSYSRTSQINTLLFSIQIPHSHPFKHIPILLHTQGVIITISTDAISGVVKPQGLPRQDKEHLIHQGQAARHGWFRQMLRGHLQHRWQTTSREGHSQEEHKLEETKV